MAKKSKKRARQAARRAQRRVEKQGVAAPLDPRAHLLKRIFNEARDRHIDAARENERQRDKEARHEERARARGQR